MHKTKTYLLSFFLLAIASTLSAQFARQGKDYAVFFVASKFDHGWSTLKEAPQEVQAIADLLRDEYDFEVKIVTDATRAKISKTLGEYKTKTYDPQDQLLLFFSMHGVHDAGSDKGYLVPKDGLEEDPTYDTWYSHSQLAEMATSIRCKRVLVALDACYSGIFGYGKGKPARAAWEMENKDCQSKLKTAFEGGETRKYLTAGGDTRVPARSIFAAQWLAALETGGGTDGLLSYLELVNTITEYKNPEPSWGDFKPGTKGDFVFVKKGGCAKPLSKDQDGDGVMDAEDNCPDQYGPKANKGCPSGTDSGPGTGFDSDYDGIPDAQDACPNAYGTLKANGCPDRDNDGVPNVSDKCPDSAGQPYWQGCPDTDGDGLPDHEDLCPSQKGFIVDKGCPPADRDRDGVPDKADKCPDEPGKDYLEGCPEKSPIKKSDNMVLIQGGTFQMGSTEGSSNEKPVHSVTVSSFYMGKFEVTVAEFRAFIEDKNYQTDAEREGSSYGYDGKEWKEINGRNWRHDPEGNPAPGDHPVINVSWNDATEYCKWLAQKTGLPYRLPTEAEWEYAAGNGAKHNKYSWGDGDPVGKKGGNVADKSLKTKIPDWQYDYFKTYTDEYAFTAPVGSFDPNTLGLYDMTGNVWEWCSDWYASDYYKNSPSKDPVGAADGSFRVIRGGSWGNDPQYCRVAFRYNVTPGYRSYNIGFRLARTK